MVGAEAAGAQVVSAERVGAGAPDPDGRHGDPLHGLVHTAVADRPLEDVARLITLLERSPEHARTTADALRAAGVDRPVEDVSRLVDLLTRPPRDSRSADVVIRAAAECRPLDEVTRLMELLHRTRVEPHCVRAAVEAVAVNRPVEELAELIARLAADGAPPAHAPLPAPPEEAAAHAVEPPPAPGPAAVVEPDDTPRPRRRHGAERVKQAKSAKDPRTATDSRDPKTGKGKADKTERSGRSGRSDKAAGAAKTSKAPLLLARGAGLLAFVCGVAHAPRYGVALPQNVLQTTLLVSGLCVVLALAMPSRTVRGRLAAATATLVVTAAFALGPVIGGRFGLPDPAQLQAAMVAPPWIAGTAAAAAALAALALLLASLWAVGARRESER
ncbi:hypothetical protein PV343_36030 [Streptomyces sp. WI03-4A]|uniref:hypothetical protein n=1 Tax=Streptomyces sp. WI03-4A TaxID=3028706 RepID=UPI0029B5A7F2|nr:hypothetical protein [Streptomyces sp. WI03-4A]MDX2597620.1 hypothetical protein [Streptomyces sp. WI03-4A]